jgi:Dolichyl-phosphate-mannose-protein mannosyltransferase
MQLIRKLRIPALFCALAVLLCELISRPFAEMGISDDGPYVLMVQKLAVTGHVVYNGWAAPMLGWQLYLAAAFIKLFGFSFTTVRMSTLFVATVLAFVLQRTLVRANISERNATIGTLALVLSPLYLMLSVTFMTDITGLFAIVLCLYACMRALQASTSGAAIGWLCFAVATNAICGTSRQTGWLGIFVIIPSTLWQLRAQRRVLIAGVAATAVGALFILGCIHWLNHQPYAVPEHLLPDTFPFAHTLTELMDFFLEAPFLLLPIVALFLPQIRKSTRRSTRIVALMVVAYILLAVLPRHADHRLLLEPTYANEGNWVGIHGIHEGIHLQGNPPVFLDIWARVLLTILSLGGVLGLVTFYLRPDKKPPAMPSSTGLSWSKLGMLLAPFTIVYGLLLIPRAAANYIFDRYLLELLVVALICLVRYYQDCIQPPLPLAGILLVAIMAIYGVASVHNMFALYRARVPLAAEMRAAGVPDTSVDNGFEYNFGVELQYADHINEEHIALPANAYVPTPPLPTDTCPMFWHDKTPHIHPLYGISFDPNACHGPAPFSPVHYSRWLARTPGTLYVVRYTAAAKP